MTATTKFYLGFFFALALIVAGAFYVGYRAGENAVPHGRATAAHRAASAPP